MIAYIVVVYAVNPFLEPATDDLTVPTRDVTPSATNLITLAASDTPESERVNADHVCSGADDAGEMQTLIDSLAPRRGTLRLLPGTFALNRTVAVRSGVTLSSARAGAAELRFNDEGWLESFNDTVLDGLRVTGSGGIYIPASDVTVRDTEVSSDETRSAAFMVYAANRVIERISFINCTARSCGTSGFMNAGEGSLRQVRNVTYTNCNAIDCGRTAPRFNDWIVGFDVAETAQVSDIRLTGCLAEGNWESGFHQEKDAVIGPVLLENCTSRGNGSKRGEVAPKYGAGYHVSGQTTVLNCFSEKNEIGFYCTSGITLRGSRDLGSVTGYRTTDGEEITIEDCTSERPAKSALEALNSREVRCVRFRVINPVSAVAAPVQIGSLRYPSSDISLDLEVTGGRDEAAVSIVNGKNIGLSVKIRTDAPHGIMIEGPETNDIRVRDSSILVQSLDGSAILIGQDVANAMSIVIDNTELVGAGMAYGVENRARDPVMVAQVTVVGARVPYLNTKEE